MPALPLPAFLSFECFKSAPITSPYRRWVSDTTYESELTNTASVSVTVGCTNRLLKLLGKFPLVS